MAKTPAAVRGLLETVWPRARERALADRDAMQALVQAEGGNFALAPWDWRYYAEKLRKVRCDFNEAEIKPYLRLENMIEAAFYTAQRLFGLTFAPRDDVPVWHEDVRVWEVRAADGRHLGLFFGDYFARASKHSGAWMTTLRDQEKLAGDTRPLVINVMNFSKGADGAPALLSFDDARTLFHEFGHALHGLLSDVTYPLDFRHRRAHRLRGTALAALRALAGAAGGAAPVRRALPHRRADAGGAARPRPRGAHLQPGLHDGRVCRRRDRRSRLPLAGPGRPGRPDGIRAATRSGASTCPPRS